jgi:hypothetical protein
MKKSPPKIAKIGKGLEMITSTIRNLIGIWPGSVGNFYEDGTRIEDDFRF